MRAGVGSETVKRRFSGIYIEEADEGLCNAGFLVSDLPHFKHYASLYSTIFLPPPHVHAVPP